MYRLIKTEGTARRGEFVTPHGTIQTPAFMNVATCGAIKGAVSALDLKNIKCQVPGEKGDTSPREHPCSW